MPCVYCHSLWEFLIEKIADCGKAFGVAPFAVNAIGNGDEANVIAGENNIRVLSDGQIVTTEA